MKRERLKFWFALSSLLVCAFASPSFMDHRVSKHYKRADQSFYQADHYVRDFNVPAVHHTLESIPKNANVSAQNMLVPHIAFRDVIYLFLVILDADHVVLLPIEENTYPASHEEYQMKVR